MYHYKYIVDGEWRFSPDAATATDQSGNVNNLIDTTNITNIIESSKGNSQISS